MILKLLRFIFILSVYLQVSKSQNPISHTYYPKETLLSISTEPKICNTPESLLKEIQSYRPVFERMARKVLIDDFKNKTWNEIVDYVYMFPKRTSGSEGLERAIDHLEDMMKNKFNFDQVETQEVPVPHWVRGKECAKLLKPYEKEISMFGLGFSVGTPPEGIIGEAIVVKDFKDLENKKDQVKGKIVVINFDYEGYGASSRFRLNGAAEASKYGAIAALIRSVANYSLYSVHNGKNDYKNATVKIPSASITIEDAFLLDLMQKKGDQIVIKLKMDAKTNPMTTSRNVFGQITGTQPDKIDQYVLLSGHIDGWDSGMGAFDDAGGVLLGVLALDLMNSLNLKPKRTIKSVAWTAEEVGYWGVGGFIANKSKEELKNIVAAFECDEGIFNPDGMDFAGNDEAYCIVKEVVKMLEPIRAGITRHFPHVSSDIYRLKDCCGTPGFSIYSRGLEQEYFNYHHTKADHPVWLKPQNVDLSLISYAFVSYVIADLSVEIPNGGGKVQISVQSSNSVNATEGESTMTGYDPFCTDC